MIDHGNSLSRTQLDTAKAVASHILESLSENDRVSVIGLSDDARFPRKDHCLTRHLVALTDEARAYFTAFIKDLQKQPGGEMFKLLQIHNIFFNENYVRRASVCSKIKKKKKKKKKKKLNLK